MPGSTWRERAVKKKPKSAKALGQEVVPDGELSVRLEMDGIVAVVKSRPVGRMGG